jgi:hypothetical protein
VLPVLPSPRRRSDWVPTFRHDTAHSTSRARSITRAPDLVMLGISVILPDQDCLRLVAPARSGMVGSHRSRFGVGCPWVEISAAAKQTSSAGNHQDPIEVSHGCASSGSTRRRWVNAQRLAHQPRSPPSPVGSCGRSGKPGERRRQGRTASSRPRTRKQKMDSALLHQRRRPAIRPARRRLRPLGNAACPNATTPALRWHPRRSVGRPQRAPWLARRPRLSPTPVPRSVRSERP